MQLQLGTARTLVITRLSSAAACTLAQLPGAIKQLVLLLDQTRRISMNVNSVVRK